MKAGTKAFGKIKSSRANPRKSEPLSLELTSISVNGRNIPVKTNTVAPGSSPGTARLRSIGYGPGQGTGSLWPGGAAAARAQAEAHGETYNPAGTLVVTPGTKMQFQLAAPASL